MADRQQIYEAIRRADRAGDADAVRRLSKYLQEQDAPKQKPASDTLGFAKGVLPYAANAVRMMAKTNPIGMIADAAGIGASPANVSASAERQVGRAIANAPRRPSLRGEIVGAIAGSAPTMAIPGSAAVQGAAAGLLGTTDRSALGLAKNAAAGAAGGYVGDKLVRGVARAVSPKVAPVVQRLKDRGVPLTLGQIAGANGGVLGRGVRAAENKLTSVPGVGDAIIQAQGRGVEAFNRAAFNEGLSPIGGRVADVAERGVEQSRQAVRNAYASALQNVSLAPDQQLAAEIAAASQKGLRPGNFTDDFSRIMTDEVQPALANPNISGQNMQDALRILKGYGRQYDKLATTGSNGIPQPSARPVGQAFGDLAASVEGLAQRQAPEVMPAYQAANEAYRNVGVLRDAVNAAKVGGGGVFTPGQLAMAARANAKKFGASHGTTNQPFFDLTRDAQDVLPNTIPNSGTADRGLLGLLLGGAGGIPALAASAAGSIPYSKPGQKAVEWALTGRQGAAAKATADLIERLLRPAAVQGGAVGFPLLFGP